MWLKTLQIFVIFGIVSQIKCAVNDNEIGFADKELLLTEKEKNTFDKFKSMVYDKIPDDMVIVKSDLYLLRFLRAKDGDLDEAVTQFKHLMDFMKTQSLRTILKEDWSDMEEEFPFFYDAVDKQLRPVVYGTSVGGWSIRNVALQGKLQRWVRYLYKMLMEMEGKLVEAGMKNANVTQVIFVMDLSDFSLRQNGCGWCVPQFMELLSVYDRWIPGYVKEIIFVNASQNIYLGLNTVRPLLPRHMSSIMKIFGSNKGRWKSYLDERIDPDQLPRFLGGNKPDPEH